MLPVLVVVVAALLAGGAAIRCAMGVVLCVDRRRCRP
jgi:hypothetical protein